MNWGLFLLHRNYFNMDYDWKESEDSYELKITVPGASKEDINLKVNNKEVKISVKETEFHPKRHYSLYIVDDVDVKGVKANVNNGVLRIKFPKKEECKFSEIEIK